MGAPSMSLLLFICTVLCVPYLIIGADPYLMEGFQITTLSSKGYQPVKLDDFENLEIVHSPPNGEKIKTELHEDIKTPKVHDTIESYNRPIDKSPYMALTGDFSVNSAYESIVAPKTFLRDSLKQVQRFEDNINPTFDKRFIKNRFLNGYFETKNHMNADFSRYSKKIGEFEDFKESEVQVKNLLDKLLKTPTIDQSPNGKKKNSISDSNHIIITNTSGSHYPTLTSAKRKFLQNHHTRDKVFLEKYKSGFGLSDENSNSDKQRSSDTGITNQIQSNKMEEMTTYSTAKLNDHMLEGCLNTSCDNNNTIPQDTFWTKLYKSLSKKQFTWLDLLVTVGCTTAFFILIVNIAFFLQYCFSHTQRRRYSPSASEHCIYGYGDVSKRSKGIGRWSCCCGEPHSNSSSMHGTDLSTVSGTMEIGTQYENSDVMIPSFVTEELIGELNDRDSTCTSISDGFTYARDFSTETREYKVGITEL